MCLYILQTEHVKVSRLLRIICNCGLNLGRFNDQVCSHLKPGYFNNRPEHTSEIRNVYV